MEGLADIASALQGESHTEETIKWSQELHDIEMNFTDELHNRELYAEQRRAEEMRDLENKLLARKLQVELDIGRRDATRDSVLLRASSVGNLLVTLSVMIGCAFMFVYQIQLPATLPESPENYTSSSLNRSLLLVDGNETNSSRTNISTLLETYSQFQLTRYQEHVKYAQQYGGGQLSFLLHTIFLWTAIGVLACAVWVGLVLHLRIKHFKVHLPLFVYDCGHVHGVFGSYYSCRCLLLEVATRRLFMAGTVLIILASCVSSYEISVVSFASLGAALCFLVPVLFSILAICVGTYFVSEETALVVGTSRSSKNKRRTGSSSTTSGNNNNQRRENSVSSSSPTKSNHNRSFSNTTTRTTRMEAIDGDATAINENGSPRSALSLSMVRNIRKKKKTLVTKKKKKKLMKGRSPSPSPHAGENNNDNQGNPTNAEKGRHLYGEPVMVRKASSGGGEKTPSLISEHGSSS